MPNRVLVVDDDRQMVETLTNVLNLGGWEADGVFSGEEAIAATRKRQYAVVLMDIKMTGMDGVATMKRLREEQSEMPILLMTAYASRDVIVEAEDQGAVRVLPKPVEPAVLLHTLELALRRAAE
jgi:DNA-binding response OmpR family regulator